MKGVIATNRIIWADRDRMMMQIKAGSKLSLLGIKYGFRVIEEYIEHEKFKPPGAYMLKRDSFSEIGGDRHLPFIKEILDQTLVRSLEPEQWIGFLNSDVIVTDALFEALNTENHIVLPVVTDIDHIDHLETGPFHKRPGDPDNPMCCDGVFMRAGIWTDNRDKIPDYVLGECYWDAGYLRHFGKMPKAVILDNGECLHVKHKGGWDTGNVDWSAKPPTGFSITGEYNQRLYFESNGE